MLKISHKVRSKQKYKNKTEIFEGERIGVDLI